jgi:hypothetical protein
VSYDKNTIDYSRLDTTKQVLEELGEEFTITYLGEVVGQGINDVPEMSYHLRKLEYRDKIMLERMERTYDCDSDDVRASYVFKKGEEPKEWLIEIFTDADEYEQIPGGD